MVCVCVFASLTLLTSHLHPYPYILACTHTHTPISSHTHTHTHTHPYPHTHTHTHTHTYTQGQTVSLFSINTSSGQISLDRPVTLADISTVTFTVVATDSGDPPLSGTADVIVRVLNSSQQQLRFRTSYIYGEIVENTRTFQSGSGVLVLNIAVGAGTPFSFAPNYTTNPFVLVPGNTVRNVFTHGQVVCTSRVPHCLPWCAGLGAQV